MAFLLNKKKGAQKVSNVQYLRGQKAMQVLRIYQIASNAAYLLWKFVKGYVYTSDGKAMKTYDGRYFKFKDQ